MDLKLLDPVITLLTWVGHAIVYTGAGIFLLAAAWCFVMEAVALLAVVLRAVLEYAGKRTTHAWVAMRAVRAESQSWIRDHPAGVVRSAEDDDESGDTASIDA